MSSKANRATDSPFHPGAQIDVLAFDPLCMGFANGVLFGVEMALVGAPPIGVKSSDTKWLSEFFTGETPHLCAAQRHMPTQSHCDDQSHAITTAARLASPHNSTSHRALRSVLGAGSTPRRDKLRPPPALGAGAATPPDLPVAAQVPFFEFFHDCGRTHVQHPRGIANATRIHRHIDDLLLHLRRETGIGIRQEKHPSTPRGDTHGTDSVACLQTSCHGAQYPCLGSRGSGALA